MGFTDSDLDGMKELVQYAFDGNETRAQKFWQHQGEVILSAITVHSSESRGYETAIKEMIYAIEIVLGKDISNITFGDGRTHPRTIEEQMRFDIPFMISDRYMRGDDGELKHRYDPDNPKDIAIGWRLLYRFYVIEMKKRSSEEAIVTSVMRALYE